MVGEPSSDCFSLHGVFGQVSGDEAVADGADRVYETAYAGIYAANDGEAVFDGPKGADGDVLGQLGGGGDLAVFVTDEPAVVTDVDEPINLWVSLAGGGEGAGYFGYGVLVANHYAEAVGWCGGVFLGLHLKYGEFTAVVERVVVVVGREFHQDLVQPGQGPSEGYNLAEQDEVDFVVLLGSLLASQIV